MDFSVIVELLSAGTPFLILGLWWLERSERLEVQKKLDKLTGIIQSAQSTE